MPMPVQCSAVQLVVFCVVICDCEFGKDVYLPVKNQIYARKISIRVIMWYFFGLYVCKPV